MTLIPRNKEDAVKLERKLSRIPAYQSSEQFIMVYNQDLVSNKNSEVNSIARELILTYKNVEKVGDKIVVLSEEELAANTAMFIVDKVTLVAQLKRIADNIAHENYSNNTKIIFKQADTGIIYILDDHINEEIIYEGSERIFGLNEKVANNPFLIPLLHGYKDEDAYINIVDLLEIDTSFIQSYNEIMKEHFNVD